MSLEPIDLDVVGGPVNTRILLVVSMRFMLGL
jgi:hypothetical protein